MSKKQNTTCKNGCKSPLVSLWPPAGLKAVVRGKGIHLSTFLEWSPPVVNAEEVGGYIVERKTWWPGTESRARILTADPVRECLFIDDETVPDLINEYRVRAVHRLFPRAQGLWSFPAAVYGFAYMRYREMVSELKKLEKMHKSILRVVDAGPASVKPYRVWCAVLGTDTGDNPDRPGLFLVGNPHGSEVEGGDVCMGIIREILRGWKRGARVFREILDTTQIRIIPVYNPGGRSSKEAGFPTGSRKNAPARRLKPPFDPLEISHCWPVDRSRGIDLNRTFDAGWELVSDADPGSGSYPGKRPLEAPEARALVRMAEALRPQISVHYHGPCSYPLLTADFPDGSRPVDRPLHLEVGRGFAGRSAPVFSNDVPGESPHPSGNRTGVAQNWFYRAFYGAHLLPEGFYGQVPADPRVGALSGHKAIPELVEKNTDAVLWLARRLHGAGIAVRVTDGEGVPLEADVEIPGRMDGQCLPQKTGRKHGAYRRILTPGVYDVKIAAAGYRTKTFKGLKVPSGKAVKINAVLEKKSSGTNSRNRPGNTSRRVKKPGREGAG